MNEDTLRIRSIELPVVCAVVLTYSCSGRVELLLKEAVECDLNQSTDFYS